MNWIVHLEGGPKRVNHAAVLIGNKIYSFGGYCSTKDYKDWDPIPIYALCTLTLRWTAINYEKNDVNPFQRYGHTVVGYDHKVYMWGGRNNSVACATLLCFNTTKKKWSAPECSGNPPWAKDGHTACVINKRMYIYGGFEYASEEYSEDIHYLEFESMVWTKINVRNRSSVNPYETIIASLPEGYPLHRDFHTAVPYGDRMYVFGGRGRDGNNEIYRSEVLYFDTTKEKWVMVHPTGDLPEGRRSHSAWVHNHNMYIFGGYSGVNKKHYNTLHRYSIRDNSWTEIKLSNNKNPSPRRRQACVLDEDKLYLFGGSSPNPHLENLSNDLDENPEVLIDNSDLHILDLNVKLKDLCKLVVLKNNLNYLELPHSIIMDIQAISVPNQITRPPQSIWIIGGS